jgi:hypothetical protein
MDEIRSAFAEHKGEIIAAAVTGAFGVLVAIIKVTFARKPVRGEPRRFPFLLFLSFFGLLLGVGCIAAENYLLNLDPDEPLTLDNHGAILNLAGWILVSVGSLWFLVNLTGLLRPKPSPSVLDALPVETPRRSEGRSRRRDRN